MLKRLIRSLNCSITQTAVNRSISKNGFQQRAFSEWKNNKKIAEKTGNPSEEELTDEQIKEHQEKIMPKLWTLMTVFFGVTTKFLLSKQKNEKDEEEKKEQARKAAEEEIFKELKILTVEMKEQLDRKRQSVLNKEQTSHSEQNKATKVEKSDNNIKENKSEDPKKPQVVQEKTNSS